MDPTYLDNSENDSESDSDSSTIEDMSLGLFTDKLIDRNVPESSEESDNVIVCTGMCYDWFSSPVGTENRVGSEVEEILTAAH